MVVNDGVYLQAMNLIKQTRGGCIGSAVLRFCSICVSQSGDRESGVGASATETTKTGSLRAISTL